MLKALAEDTGILQGRPMLQFSPLLLSPSSEILFCADFILRLGATKDYHFLKRAQVSGSLRTDSQALAWDQMLNSEGLIGLSGLHTHWISLQLGAKQTKSASPKTTCTQS